MGKPFCSELKLLQSTLYWADNQDITSIADYLYNKDISSPLICIGSGGSFSACSYASLLYRLKNGVLATGMTPLELMYSGSELMRNSKLLYLSASGKNKDIINSIKYGLKYNERYLMSISLKADNPTVQLLQHYSKSICWCKDIPSGKDGFLATNSLFAMFALLCRSYDGKKLNNIINFEDGYYTSKPINWNAINNFIILYGASGEPVAKDIESKLTEAALGSASLCDYRNFGHGRHHWFAKHSDNSCIILLISSIEKELALKTIKCLPTDIPVVYIESILSFPQSSVELLAKSFKLIEDLGVVRGFDPGRPGVPSFGRLLYNLNYFKLTKHLLPNESILHVAIKRKLKNVNMYDSQLYDYYRNQCKVFIHRLNHTTFNAVAFDYDGTLSSSDYDNRYKNTLRDDVKNALTMLLSNGIEVRIATGRGKSVKEIFCREFDRNYWKLITIGFYNGAYVYNLDYDIDSLEQCKALHLDNSLQVLKDELLIRLPLSNIKYHLEERHLQLSITDIANSYESDLIYITCNEIIWDLKLNTIHVWKSSHSMDIVVYNTASKLRALSDNNAILCIGDYGNIEGNDYELLTSEYSLSVDQTSKNPNKCWNVAPSGTLGVDATLYYLNHLNINKGSFTCNFKV